MYNDKTMKQKESIKSVKSECVILLHDIRSIVNVGAIFRTADALGISKIILSGITPTPIDRFGRMRDDFSKSALGAENSITWEYNEKPLKIITQYKKSGYTIVSLEQNPRSIDYKRLSFNKNDKILFVPGSEVSGVPQNIIKKSDYIVEIPMRGIKESLNVSVATGIVLYRLLDR